MIPLDEALRQVLERAGELEPLRVSLSQALGGWLLEAVTSDVDLPPADVSAMDGYALRAADVAHPVAELEVVGEIPAGRAPGFEVGPGQEEQVLSFRVPSRIALVGVGTGDPLQPAVGDAH